MKYVVIKYFTDLTDRGYAYHVGDEFPRQGVSVSQKRIEELSSDKNRRHTPLIKAVESASPSPEKVVEDVKTDESTPSVSEAQEKPKKSRRRK